MKTLMKTRIDAMKCGNPFKLCVWILGLRLIVETLWTSMESLFIVSIYVFIFPVYLQYKVIM